LNQQFSGVALGAAVDSDAVTVPGTPIGTPVASWEVKYRAVVICSDLMAVLFATACAGLTLPDTAAGTVHGHLTMASATVATILIGLWLSRAWESRVLGQGTEEFRRLSRGIFGALVTLGLVGLAMHADQVRPWVFGVIPAGGTLALTGRYVLRRNLHARRRAGHCLIPVLAAGAGNMVADLIERTRREQYNGWRVEAVCTTEGIRSGEVAGVPVVGSLEDFPGLVRLGGYRVAAVAPDPHWTPQRLRQLAWSLEGSAAEMVVAPVLMEVAGSRVHVAPVFGLPLLRLSEPAFTGVRRVVKEIFDRLGAAALLVGLAPILGLIAVFVWAHDRGPVFYRQQRVGRSGARFTMWKFRTMVVDAHRNRAALTEHDEGAGPLFKLRQDPRITGVGAVLRRYSLDELPQLINVVTGTMSLVGPRPPLPEEAERYDTDVRRRLMVKPGLTGLWQVSGRSDLSWDDAVRLDLCYVEDWSLAMDAVILWKTVWAVIRGHGAY
jgi:exopolysaccharide biosynthesis polyprenyl glycosylphosphotransferase